MSCSTVPFVRCAGRNRFCTNGTVAQLSCATVPFVHKRGCRGGPPTRRGSRPTAAPTAARSRRRG
ncbi:hypothetical protein ACFPM0_04060 [Pseudonocardia sulfidoxydans]|uniref:hypothetical protein n=1 Tax=Pseudonocardia sulfidoxydans TaxID=54011 RepID=UPI00360CA7D8